MDIKCQKFYDAHISKYRQTVNNLKHLFNKDSIIFDIGSNIGLFSLAICEISNYNSIYLFEPVSDYYNYSKYLLGKFNNIYIENIGISNEEGKSIIYKNSGDNIGWNSILLKDPLQSQGLLPIHKMDQENINLTTLNEYCKNNNILRVDFVKIDVEGLEHKVIEGFLDFLEKLTKKPYLYVEVGWGVNHPEWENAYIIYEKLFNLGYKRVTFSNKTEDILFEPL